MAYRRSNRYLCRDVDGSPRRIKTYRAHDQPRGRNHLRNNLPRRPPGRTRTTHRTAEPTRDNRGHRSLRRLISVLYLWVRLVSRSYTVVDVASGDIGYCCPLGLQWVTAGHSAECFKVSFQLLAYPGLVGRHQPQFPGATHKAV